MTEASPFTYDLAEFLSVDVEPCLVPAYESEQAAVLAGHVSGEVYKDSGGRFFVVGPLPAIGK